VLWEGGLERKCKLVESPNRSMVLADDTRGEGTTKRSPTPPASDSDVQAWIPEADNASPQSAGADSTLSKEEQIDVLLKERERCQNELQKLKDIIGLTSVKASSEYRTRDSYLPETGACAYAVRGVRTLQINPHTSAQCPYKNHPITTCLLHPILCAEHTETAPGGCAGEQAALGGARPSHRALVRAAAELDLACEEVRDG